MSDFEPLRFMIFRELNDATGVEHKRVQPFILCLFPEPNDAIRRLFSFWKARVVLSSYLLFFEKTFAIDTRKLSSLYFLRSLVGRISKRFVCRFPIFSQCFTFFSHKLTS